MIQLSGLGVTFPDGTTGLSDINLSVEPGEFVALVGPSGSGKTTLLRTIAGFIEPTEGTLLIDGDPMRGVPPEKRHLGMVFQQHAVWPHMNVYENVAYPLRRGGVFSAEHVGEALEMVGLEGFAKRKPASLSGGQRQRVALARAIVADPRVLLLDEALSALDEPLRDSLRRDLVTLVRSKGLTTIHVTHDRAEALALADRVVVLSGGKILQVAPPAELLSAPISAEVASFIADATVLPSGEWVLPSDVTVVPEKTGKLDGTVQSVLFERGGYSVTVLAGELTFRAFTEEKLEVGQHVGVDFP
ncbi:ABC transporter ATP-binding protein [Corynebacterium hindlerae]|uniref:ABC transporter ATP-binding protein n=1 Tax=Corynebacterium hindlerae TaxID=699041 RepID=UPI0031B6FF23